MIFKGSSIYTLNIANNYPDESSHEIKNKKLFTTTHNSALVTSMDKNIEI